VKSYTLEELKALDRETWTEKQFTRIVIEHAQALGWIVAHFRPGMTGRIDKNGRKAWVTAVSGNGKGWPDLVMFRGTQAIAWELKVKKNAATREQKDWLDVLNSAGFYVGVCYPRHWNTMMANLR
jgi:hypothetical protein